MEISKKTIVIAVVGVGIFFYLFDSFTCRTWLRKNVLPIGYQGKVVSKYIDSLNWNGLKIVLDDHLTYQLFNYEMYSLCEKGDIVIKKKRDARSCFSKRKGYA